MNCKYRQHVDLLKWRLNHSHTWKHPTKIILITNPNQIQWTWKKLNTTSPQPKILHKQKMQAKLIHHREPTPTVPIITQFNPRRIHTHKPVGNHQTYITKPLNSPKPLNYSKCNAPKLCPRPQAPRVGLYVTFDISLLSVAYLSNVETTNLKYLFRIKKKKKSWDKKV